MLNVYVCTNNTNTKPNTQTHTHTHTYIYRDTQVFTSAIQLHLIMSAASNGARQLEAVRHPGTHIIDIAQKTYDMAREPYTIATEANDMA